ncbi:MAG: hypothetical protein HKL85_09250 [Acidimicrobiaceae bacterium]|nr:hypothetical protein [Acidimicrobiaceae bacterium]
MDITIVSAHATSVAAPASFFDRWADVATWPEWDSDIAWARLDGPFAEGSTGVIKPLKGPRTKFVIERLDLGRSFVDVSRLPGARLTFSHLITDETDGGCAIDVVISLGGPLAPIWKLLLARGFTATTQITLDRLVEVVEAAR